MADGTCAPNWPLRIPTATYRLQFNAGFGFKDATAILPYLHELGVTDIYASPYLKARAGSTHGYDIVSHDGLNPEVGSVEDFRAFAEQLREFGMGQILDIVPNHMCVEGGENPWWQDLLENGPSSLHARTFDIDWDPVKKELRNKVLIPVLGDQYGIVLENGELVLGFGDGAFTLRYYEHRFPIIPKTFNLILGHRLDALAQTLGGESLPYQEFLSIMTALEHLPFYTETDPGRIEERYREKEVVKRRLQRLCDDCGEVAAFIVENVRLFNGRPGEPESFDLLDRLLAMQVYRIAHWQVATEEINYRRFFDINALGAIRVEDEAVFARTHQFILGLVRDGAVTGLRVDHVDGLYDPTGYLWRLQEQCRAAVLGDDETAVGKQDTGSFSDSLKSSPASPCFYVVGEKILMQDERLPVDWPVHGATGYAFLNCLNSLFVDTSKAQSFDAIYRRFIRDSKAFSELAIEAKRLVMQVSMSSEINNLAHYLNLISERNRHTRDFTLNSLTKALIEVIAFFPVYRTYIRNGEIPDPDRQIIEQAVTRARRRNPAMVASIFDFIRNVLLLRCPSGGDEEDLMLYLDFIMRFQQLTGPVMAKGLEDTAFYVYNRLTSLNEVGGSPDRFGCTPETFHRINAERLASHPYAMLATATHDTKRGEDVRARINALSEIPDPWRKALNSWSQLNKKKRKVVDGLQAPSRNEEYLFYQTLLGAWPLKSFEDGEFDRFRQRIKEYMRKALREAKVHSSWVNPNTSHEEAVDAFIDAVLGNGDTPFVRSLAKLTATVSRLGMFNSLSQTLLKITSPGLPDFYQGTELWDLSLVDPDNRRPVDFTKRAEMLRGLQVKEHEMGLASLCGELLQRMEDGRVKLFLAWKALTFRRNNMDIFKQGNYTPLTVRGEKSESVVTFKRSFAGREVVVAVPRFVSRLVGEGLPYPLGREAWGDTSIEFSQNTTDSPLRSESEPGDASVFRYNNIFTGETIAVEGGACPNLPLAIVLRQFPVAVLVRVPNDLSGGPS